METKIDLILEKLTRMEKALFNVNDETIKEFLDDNVKENFIGVNTNLIYESYKNVTGGTASKRALGEAIKKTFGLRIKHTTKTKNRTNIYYWGE